MSSIQHPEVQELLERLHKKIDSLQLSESDRDVWTKTMDGARDLASAGLLNLEDVQSITDELDEDGIEALTIHYGTISDK